MNLSRKMCQARYSRESRLCDTCAGSWAKGDIYTVAGDRIEGYKGDHGHATSTGLNYPRHRRRLSRHLHRR